MGTNFYMITRSKEKVLEYAPEDYRLVDDPYIGYEFHVAKTSGGWLPLFQGHKDGINSVKQYKEAYDAGCVIYDEYGDTYLWEQFVDRVLKFNGGTAENRELRTIPKDPLDHDMPTHVPVSHFEYGNGRYAQEFFKDEYGYEFDSRSFS